MKRLLALTLALLLCCPAALAGMDALDGEISPWLAQNGELSTAISMELGALMPFGEDTLQKLNGAAKHLLLEMRVSDAGEAARLTLGDAPLFTLTQNGDNLALDLLPGRTLAGTDAALSLLDAEDAHAPAYAVIDAAAESDQALPALQALLETDAEENKSTFKVKSIGTSKTSCVLKLTAEQTAGYSPAVLAMLLCGMDGETRRELTGATCQKGFTVALYYLEDGTPMALLLKGKLDAADDRSYTVNYLWGFKREAQTQADSCKLTLTGKGDGAKTRTIVGTRKRTQEAAAFSLEVSGTVTVKLKSNTDKYISSISLTGEGESARTLKGTIKTDHQHVATGSTRWVTTLQPELTSEGGALSGQIILTQLRDKQRQTALSLRFVGDTSAELAALGGYTVAEGGDEATTAAPSADAADVPLGMTAHAVPDAPQSLLLSALSEDEKAALWDEAAQQLGARLLAALYQLPEEDRAILTDGMNEQDAQALLTLLGGLQ